MSDHRSFTTTNTSQSTTHSYVESAFEFSMTEFFNIAITTSFSRFFSLISEAFSSAQSNTLKLSINITTNVFVVEFDATDFVQRNALSVRFNNLTSVSAFADSITDFFSKRASSELISKHTSKHSSNFSNDSDVFVMKLRRDQTHAQQKRDRKHNKHHVEKLTIFEKNDIVKIKISSIYRSFKCDYSIVYDRVTTITREKKYFIQTQIDMLINRYSVDQLSQVFNSINKVKINDFSSKTNIVNMKQLVNHYSLTKLKQIICKCRKYSCADRCVCRKYEKECFYYCHNDDKKCDNCVEDKDFKDKTTMFRVNAKSAEH